MNQLLLSGNKLPKMIKQRKANFMFTAVDAMRAATVLTDAAPSNALNSPKVG